MGVVVVVAATSNRPAERATADCSPRSQGLSLAHVGRLAKPQHGQSPRKKCPDRMGRRPRKTTSVDRRTSAPRPTAARSSPTARSSSAPTTRSRATRKSRATRASSCASRKAPASSFGNTSTTSCRRQRPGLAQGRDLLHACDRRQKDLLRQQPLRIGLRRPTDGKTVWKLDMIKELGVFPHNLSTSSPLVVGDMVFAVTSNGVDEDHINIPAPRLRASSPSTRRPAKWSGPTTIPARSCSRCRRTKAPRSLEALIKTLVNKGEC